MKKEINYEQRIRLCKLLGADIFKDVVFQVERIKFKIIKKFFPNYIKYVDKYIDNKTKKILKKAKTNEEKKQIRENSRRQKLAARKELNWEQNRNYHLDSNRPTEIIEYLNWNKQVHISGMLFNIGALTGLAVATVAGIAPAIALTLMLGEAASLFINFQCVNLQNLNIYRIKKDEEKLQRIESKTNERNIRRYAKGAEAVGRTLQKTHEIPTTEQVVENVQSKEEVEQLLSMIRATRAAKEKAAQQNRAVDKASTELLAMFTTQNNQSPQGGLDTNKPKEYKKG